MHIDYPSNHQFPQIQIWTINAYIELGIIRLRISCYKPHSDKSFLPLAELLLQNCGVRIVSICNLTDKTIVATTQFPIEGCGKANYRDIV